MKLLYVSESLAENVHSRGIFTFSSNLLEAIAKDGWEVYLFTDRFGSRSIASRLRKSFPEQAPTLDAAAAASHIHNFGNDKIRFVGTRVERLMRQGRRILTYLRVFSRVGNQQSLTLVPIDTSRLEFLTEKTGFLKYVRGLAVTRHAYTAAKILGSWGVEGTIDRRERV